MLVQLREFIAANEWTDLVLLPFFSMVDRRKSLHHEVIADAREQYPELLATEVPYWSDIERMSLRRAPLPAYAPLSAAARVYATLWGEIEARMGAAPPEGAASASDPRALERRDEQGDTVDDEVSAGGEQ